jgi:hypothetical protein
MVQENPLPAKRAARYVQLFAEAIHYAHGKGILHRDLKPSNVLIDANDQPHITDFGLAKRLGEDSGMTMSGQVLGTPSYLPPEQASSKRGTVGPHSDVYSLGAILYHLLAGRPPFLGTSVTETLDQVLNTEPAAPRALNPGVPKDLETICLKCLEKDFKRRYASAKELAEDLKRWLEGIPILARPITATERAVKWVRRKPAIASLVGAITFTVVIGFCGVFWQWRQAEAARQKADENSKNETAQRRLAQVATKRAENALDLIELKEVEHLFAQTNAPEAQALMARTLKRNPQNALMANRAVGSFHAALPVPIATIRDLSDVTSVRFSPDGLRILTASAKHGARVWDASTGRPLTEPMTNRQTYMMAANFSPDVGRSNRATIDWSSKTFRGWSRISPIFHGWQQDCHSILGPHRPRLGCIERESPDSTAGASRVRTLRPIFPRRA